MRILLQAVFESMTPTSAGKHQPNYFAGTPKTYKKHIQSTYLGERAGGMANALMESLMKSVIV